MPTPIYERGLDQNEANHVPLTPLHSLDRCANLFPDRIAIVHGAMRQTWARDAQPLPTAGQRARPAWYQARRHRIDHCAEYARAWWRLILGCR